MKEPYITVSVSDNEIYDHVWEGEYIETDEVKMTPGLEKMAITDLLAYLRESECEIARSEEDKGELRNIFKWFLGREPKEN